MSTSLMKWPSAFFPLAMSLAALALALGCVTAFGVVHRADEGTAAQVFQLLMAAQVPIVALFAIRWLPRSSRRALPVPALQDGAALAANAPVIFLGL